MQAIVPILQITRSDQWNHTNFLLLVRTSNLRDDFPFGKWDSECCYSDTFGPLLVHISICHFHSKLSILSFLESDEFIAFSFETACYFFIRIVEFATLFNSKVIKNIKFLTYLFKTVQKGASVWISRYKPRQHSIQYLTYLYFTSVNMYNDHIWLHFIIIKQGGNDEENLGPCCNSCQSFSMFHWSLNSVFTHDCIELSLLPAYIAINQCNVLFPCETFLDSSILSDDANLIIFRDIIQQEQTFQPVLNVAVLVFIFEIFPCENIIDVHFLQQYMNPEMRIRDKVSNFISLYRSPNQSLENLDICRQHYLRLDETAKKTIFNCSCW